MLLWTLFGILDPLLFSLGFYFTYVFINKKDISFRLKILLGAAVLPAILLVSKNTIGVFDLANCEPMQGGLYDFYIFGLELFFTLLTIIFSFISYRKAERDEKKLILYVSAGILLFFLSFFVAGALSSYLDEKGFAYAFEVEQYGYFSMTIFMAFLAYLIVRFKAFNIKMMATNALVAALVILIGSELFYATSAANQILILITLAISLGFGYMLVKSVKLEVERKEQLQVMSDKLASANDQLRQLDNTKSEFISIASHQLRTPLTAIKGFLSLLLEGSYGRLTIKHKDVLNKIYTSNERLISLVEDLLNLSRIESGRMEYNFEKIDMAGVCQEVYDTFLLKAKDRKLKLCFEKPEGISCEAMTDRNKIREVVSNLVDNAIKYTVKGGVTMRIKNIGEFVEIRISDTGIGVPETELPYLFQKFSRGKDINRLNTGGTGLGLHVGKKMIDALHGNIWAESKGEGTGSTFVIDVPVEVAV